MLPKTIAVNQDMLWSFHSSFFALSTVIVDELFRSFMQIRQWMSFFLEKTSPSPTLPFCMKTWRQVDEVYYSSILLGKIFVSFWRFQPSLRKSTKFVFEFCGLDPIGRLALVDTATLSCFNHDFLQISAGAPCSFISTILSRKTFQQFALKKNL
jgi:hypothetical protein